MALSSVVRPLTYISAAANKTQSIPGVSAYRSKLEWPDLVASQNLVGLEKNDMRVPTQLLDLVDENKIKFNRLVHLGRALFHDPILSSYEISKNHSKSCSSCHSEDHGFSSPTHSKFDNAIGGGTLTLNTPTIFNRLFSIRQFLDTRSSDLLDQATGPIMNPLEMGGNLEIVLNLINKSNWSPGVTEPFINVSSANPVIRPKCIRTYQQWFCLAFNGASDCPHSFSKNDLKQALALYELTLTRANTPVDQMKLGQSYQDAFSRNGYVTSVSEGYRIFQGKGRCIGCHSGANFSDELLHQSGPLVGAKPIKIKTPTLRGLKMTFPYFHDGSNGQLSHPSWCQYDTDDSEQGGSHLCKVVEFYNKGACRMKDTVFIRSYKDNNDPGVLNSMDVNDIACDPETVSLGLSASEKRNLVEFLMNL